MPVAKETLASRIQAERFSKWNLLLYTTARILLLYERYKQREQTKTITPKLIRKAEDLWLKEAQAGITEKQYVKLRPQYENGIIVVGGRTERWMECTWNRQKFVLLPKNSHISLLISRYIHEIGGHLGEAATISKIRSKYWIIGVASIVKSIIRECRKCKEKLKILSNQVMSPLPVERIKPAPAFSNVGVDYFGPFQVRGEVQKRVIGKCYGVLFVCLCSRAIHADIANDYSTDGFLHVLRRFASLRGWPSKFISDQGTQLVGASNELKETIRHLDWEKITQYGHEHGTEWSFSPASAPWYNGATEALVKCTKRALNSSIGDQILRFSEMQTVMMEAAQLVNQRPIGRHPVHPDEESYLSPNDLLLGRASPDVPQMPMEPNVTGCRRFNFTQSIKSAFWKKWSRDVFPNLVAQPKWHTAQRNLQEGDVVLVQDNNMLRGKWKLAVVKLPKTSKDGKVRRAVLSYRSETGAKIEIDRPVQRLILLVPANDSEVKGREECSETPINSFQK